MLKDLRNNNHGIVFITVLIIIIVAMVLALSALSLNVSQVRSAENELKYIQGEVLADGGLYRLYMDQFDATPSSSITYTETIGNTTFTITTDIDGAGSGPPGTEVSPMDVVVTF